MKRCLYLVIAVASLGGARPAAAQRDALVPDPDPAKELATFQVGEGFEVNLFAAEPLVTKPIQMNFDPAGRLWVVSSQLYPQIAPGQVPSDRVLVLEDTDHDGRADRSTEFAGGLLIPTGVEPGDGGAYVGNSTELLHLKDSDGDGKADVRRTLLSGFGTEDTHHIIHTFRWGYDGALYFNQSTYIHSHVETPYGVRRLGGGGIWQFRPESQRLEVFTRGLINPWGHHQDRWGQSFATDGAGGDGINFMIPGASYAWTPGAARMVAGLNPGSPKHCGAEVVSGRHFPEDCQGQIVTNDFRAHRVCRFALDDDGSGFASRELPELIRSDHPAFRPVDVKLGPDGALYVADWYNPIIQHGEVDFRDPRRDHTHGRIWRITAKGRPLAPRPELVEAPVADLLEALRAPEGWTRHQARRVLKERGVDAVRPALEDWVQKLDPAGSDIDALRLEALWTFQALDIPAPELLAALLDSKEPRARAAAVRVAAAWAERVPSVVSRLQACAADEHPRVRLEAVRALAGLPSIDSARAVLTGLDRPVDRFLDYAIWLSLRELAPVWVPAFRAGTLTLGTKPEHALFALEAAGSTEIVPALLDGLRSGSVPAAARVATFRLVGQLGRPEDLTGALALVLAGSDPAELEAVAAASAARKVRPAGGTPALADWLRSPEPGRRVAAARAAGLWQVEGLREPVEALIRDTAAPEATRVAAVEAAGRLGGSGARSLLDEVARSETQAAVRQAAVIGLAGLDPKAAAPRAVAWLGSSGPGDPVEGVFRAFVDRRGGPEALVAALRDQTLPRDAAKVGLRVARGVASPDAALIEALTKAGGLDAAVTLSPAEREQVLVEAARSGDPARGEAIYRRADLACIKCHSIAGAGGRVGPGLESLGASAPPDYILDSLIEPQKAVKENYHAIVVATADGRIVTGIKLRETTDQLVLRDADDREQTIPLADVEEQKAGGSLMPVGQVDLLTRSELADLVRFLSELGKPGPFAVAPDRLVRRWEVIVPGSSEQARNLARFGYVAALRGESVHEWKPVQSTVAGVLPIADLVPFETMGEKTRMALLRFEIEVTTPGPVGLTLNAPAGSYELWLDGHKQPPMERTVLDLSTAGRHTVTLAVMVDRLREGVRCALEEVEGSPARAQLVLDAAADR